MLSNTNSKETLSTVLKNYYEKIDNMESDNEKVQLLQELKEKTLKNLNDTFYYRDASQYDLVLEDTRTIFICNENEVYIVPFSRKELNEKN